MLPDFFPWGASVAVSYTHLDVYKRQFLYKDPVVSNPEMAGIALRMASGRTQDPARPAHDRRFQPGRIVMQLQRLQPPAVEKRFLPDLAHTARYEHMYNPATVKKCFFPNHFEPVRQEDFFQRRAPKRLPPYSTQGYCLLYTSGRISGTGYP